MKKLRTRFGFGLFAAVSLLSMVLSLIPVAKVLAASETYTWKDYNTIHVSGGNLKGAYDLKLIQGSNPQAFNSTGKVDDKAGCDTRLVVKISSDTAGTSYSQLPYKPTQPELRGQGSVFCSDWGVHEVC